MSKYHVNSNGEAGKCRAQKGNCPFGGETEHYDSIEKAQAAAEKQLEQEFSDVSTVVKAPEQSDTSNNGKTNEAPLTANEVLNVSDEEWSVLTPESKMKKLEESLEVIRTLLPDHGRTASKDEELSFKFNDWQGTIRGENGTFYIPRNFIDYASVQEVYHSFVQTYGQFAYGHQNDKWKQGMESAGVSQDNHYLRTSRVKGDRPKKRERIDRRAIIQQRLAKK